MTDVVFSCETILFDLDDTLIDTCVASFKACVASAAALDLDPPDWHRFLHVYGSTSFQTCFATWFGTSEGFQDFAALYRRTVQYRSIGDIQGMLLSLQARGVRLGIVTNSLECAAKDKLRSADIPLRLFSFIVGRSPGSLDEFAPKPFDKLLGTYCVNARSATYISDNPVDVVATRRAGLAFKGVLTGAYGKDDFRAFNVSLRCVYRNVHSAVAREK
ncbi:MAG: HAD family hydrolase [Actinomycetota bacterium]|nr:HAD family hydrolase [Actinomycetota bacterium]